MMMEDLPDFRDVESKLGRKVPESLIRSFAGEPFRGSETRERTDDLQTLHNKTSFLRQQMVSESRRAIQKSRLVRFRGVAQSDSKESLRLMQKSRAERFKRVVWSDSEESRRAIQKSRLD